MCRQSVSAPSEFATELLQEADDYPSIRDAHLAWFAGLAERSELALLGPEQPEWLGRIAADQGNFRSALKWALDQGHIESSLRLSSALWRLHLPRASTG